MRRKHVGQLIIKYNCVWQSSAVKVKSLSDMKYCKPQINRHCWGVFIPCLWFEVTLTLSDHTCCRHTVSYKWCFLREIFRRITLKWALTRQNFGLCNVLNAAPVDKLSSKLLPHHPRGSCTGVDSLSLKYFVFDFRWWFIWVRLGRTHQKLTRNDRSVKIITFSVSLNWGVLLFWSYPKNNLMAVYILPFIPFIKSFKPRLYIFATEVILARGRRWPNHKHKALTHETILQWNSLRWAF